MESGVFFRNVLTMAAVTYLIRMLPLAAVRAQVRNPFFLSFLRYVPYAVLGAMTFPAVFSAAGSVPASLCGLAAGLALGWLGKGLFTVAVCACAAAYLAGLCF